MDQRLEVRENTDMNPKLVLFEGLTSLINSRIGRRVKDYELRAVAFAVDELYMGSETMTPDQFLNEKLGAREGDIQRDVSWHIYDTVYNLKKKKLGREIELASGRSDQQKLESLNKIGDYMEDGYNMTQSVYRDGRTSINTIGSVMEEWAPEWFSSPQAR